MNPKPTVLSCTLVAIALCTAFCRGALGDAKTESARPNVLLIVADDLGYCDIAPFGGGGRKIEPLRGRSLTVLRDESKVVHKGDLMVNCELFGFRAVRKGDYKLLWLPKPFGSNDWQLYDLAKDPGELRDLSKQRPKLRDEMAKAWERYARETGVVIPSVTSLDNN